MKITICTFLLAGLLVSPGWARKQEPVAPCQTKFTVTVEDTLGNISQGLPAKQAKWFEKKIQKKYPDACYEAPGPDVAVLFFIKATPAVYHGTKTHSTPVSGTATDNYGNTVDVDGTVRTVVPYTHHYSAFTLSVEQAQPNGTWKVRRRFQQAELVRVWRGGLESFALGSPLGSATRAADNNRFRKVIEETVKWVHQGGLTNPLETVAVQ